MDINTIKSALVRFRTRSDGIVGLGFMVDDKHVLTCAHVVNSALGLTRNAREWPQDSVVVDFPYHDSARGEANVIRWFFKPPIHNTDIAILKLATPPPDVTRNVTLERQPRDWWGGEARTFGFPAGYPDGASVEGVFRMEQAGDLLQLDARAETQFFVEEGFSGAPVWDAHYRCAGMVVTVAHLRTAFLIPAHRLAEALQRQAAAPSPAQVQSSLFPKATQLILPHVTTPDERETWLSQAFYATDRRLYDELAASLSGAPIVFTTNLLKTLWDAECFPDGQHALSVFLNAVCLVCDNETKADILALNDELDTLCGSQRAVPTPSPTPPRPAGDTLTIDTPVDQRTRTVFVSYAHHDAAFAQRLIDDLQAAGHACWIDTTEIKGGAKWTRAISEGINNSYAFLSIVSEAGNESDWVQKEFLWAEQKKKRIFPVIAEECELPIYMIHLQATAFHVDYRDGLHRLLDALPAPVSEPGAAVREVERPAEAVAGRKRHVEEVAGEKRPISQRALELEYLDFLRFEELVNTEKYTPMAGTAQVQQWRTVRRPGVASVVIRPEFEHLQRDNVRHAETQTRKFEDIITAINDIRRAVVLGEPGAGKTTTLWKLARNKLDVALEDPRAPIPVLVRLGRWTDAGQPLEDFIALQLGGLGAHLDALLTEKRAVLLLDGLNEIPLKQRDAKARQVQRLFDAHSELMAVVTCREQDYTLNLGFDRIVIMPLDPLRIREFVTRYLDPEQGETLFWRLAGEEAQLYERAFREQNSGLFETWEMVFWLEEKWPEGSHLNVRDSQGWLRAWDDWLRMRDHSGSLMKLARNAYMLLMMTEVFARDGDLPDNRGELFSRFVDTLLEREHITDEAPALERGLARLAYEMQVQRSGEDDGSAVTVSPRDSAAQFLTERQLYLANSASILSVDEGSVRFMHQLLQEFFAAVYMRDEIEAGRLQAQDIWPPDEWWWFMNWEEAVILLAGLYTNDCTSVVEWVAEAQPEVAAMCVKRSGSYTPAGTLEHLQAIWIPRLADLDGNPHPQGRAAIGRALGMLDLDNRPGVGVGINGLPDIDWVEIPEGEFNYQYGELAYLPTFWIARYPVTYKQFQAFIDDDDGFRNAKWWEGLAAKDEHKIAPGEQAYKYWNHPREHVSWYDAVAFCRWLSEKLGYTVRMPTEQEWEKAARGTDGREYPWGTYYVSGIANIDETSDRKEVGPYFIGETTAVGIYPHNASPYGVLDMAGNVWCWTLNEFDNPQVTDLGGAELRVLRDASWGSYVDDASCMSRYGDFPNNRDMFVGFRIVCTFPQQS